MKDCTENSPFLARLRRWLERLTGGDLFARFTVKTGKTHRGGEMRSRRKTLRHEPLEERQLLAVDLTAGLAGDVANFSMPDNESYVQPSEFAPTGFDSALIPNDVAEVEFAVATVLRWEDTPRFRDFQPVAPEIDPEMVIAQLQLYKAKRLAATGDSTVDFAADASEEFFPAAREHGSIRPLEFTDGTLADEEDGGMMMTMSGGEFSVSNIYWSTFSGGARLVGTAPGIGTGVGSGGIDSAAASGGIYADMDSPGQANSDYKQFKFYVTANNTTDQPQTVTIEALDIVNWVLPGAGTIIADSAYEVDNYGVLLFAGSITANEGTITFAPNEFGTKEILVTVGGKYVDSAYDGNAYAGDNWKFRATWGESGGSGGSGGSASCLTPLTVWRRLNVECDAMPYFTEIRDINDPNWSPSNPCDVTTPPSPEDYLDGLVAEQLARACVALEVYTPNLNQPTVGHNPMTGDDFFNVLKANYVEPDPNQPGFFVPDPSNMASGRGIPYSTDDFWTVRIVMTSTIDGTVGALVPNTNTVLLFYETLGFIVNIWEIATPDEAETLHNSIQAILLHELCHLLIDGNERIILSDNGLFFDITNQNASPLIDESTLNVRDTFLRADPSNPNQAWLDLKNQVTYARLLTSDIQDIQYHSRARN